MMTQIHSVFDQVAALHHTTPDAVREEIARALSLSGADPSLSAEEFITFAALSIVLSREA